MIRSTLILVALAAFSCATGGRYRSAGSLDDGLLQYASESEREAVSAARMAFIESQDATAAAEHRSKHAGADRKVLAAELRAAKDRVSREQERMAALAEVEVDAERLAEMKGALSEAEKEVQVAEQKISLHDAQAEELKAQVKLAKAEEDHAAAVVDLRKARALKSLEREETNGIDVSVFERAERDCETEIEINKTVMRSAQREVSILEEQLYWKD